MKNFRHFLQAILLSFALAWVAVPAAHADTSVWNIDPPHANATFAITHLGLSIVRGSFTQVSGSGHFDGKDLSTASVEAVIQVSSLDTRVAMRDGHLKSPDFFDAAKFPTMTFKSTKFTTQGAHRFTMIGDLTIKGVTKSVVFQGTWSGPIKDPMGKTSRLGAVATARINRLDFGVSWNKPLESGGLMVGTDVDLTLDVEFVKAP